MTHLKGTRTATFSSNCEQRMTPDRLRKAAVQQFAQQQLQMSSTALEGSRIVPPWDRWSSNEIGVPGCLESGEACMGIKSASIAVRNCYRTAD